MRILDICNQHQVFGVGHPVMTSSLHNARYRKLVQRLREAREAAGLTQADVAEELGVPQSWISRCETRQRRIDLIELEDLAELYGKPLRFFATKQGKSRQR